MRGSALFIVVAIILAAVSPVLAADLETIARDIESSLICYCGCTMVVASCSCGTAEQIRADIRQRLAAGEDRDDILAAYVAQYGDTVLAYPDPAVPFNLTAWVMPFLGVAAGGTLIFFLVRAWVRNYRDRRDEAGEAEEGMFDDKYRRRAEEEWKDYF